MRVRVSTWISVAALVVCVALIAVLAVLSQGYPVRKFDLNDSGIWVTNDAEMTLGRVNKSAMGLDAWVDAPGGTAKRELDVFQDGNAVLEFDTTSGIFVPINSAEVTNVNESSRALPAGSVVDLRGGTAATLDPATGAVRANRYDPKATQVEVRSFDTESSPLVELGKAPEGARRVSLAVGTDGAVHAVMSSGKLVTIPALEGGFGKPNVSQLSTGLKGVQLTAVGGRPVVFDADTGTLVLPDGRTKQLDIDPTAVIQKPGDDAKAVLIATSKGLLRVALNDGTVTQIARIQGGQPAVPVRVADCDFGAWAGASGGAVRACGDGQSEDLPAIHKAGPLARPVFRVNRNQVVLNDRSDGRTFDLSTQNRLDDWDKIKPKAGEQNQNPTNQVKPNKNDAKPVAQPDTVGLRQGRAAIGHLLDNDTDALGQILMISDVTGVPDGVSVVISPDAQTVAIKAPANAANFSFNYSISNGTNSSSSTVSVQVLGPESKNRDPRLRVGFQDVDHTVASFGTLPLSVLADWRDDDGDALAVVSAEVDGQPLPVTPEGRIEYVAGREESRVTKNLIYRVSDGLTSKPVEHKVPILVLEANGLTGTGPTANPDSVRGEVGKAVSFNPLANDEPGSDPRMPDARLRLGAQVKPTSGLKIDSDLNSGEVRVIAAAPGSYEFDYVAAFGSSAMQSGKVRLDIAPASSGQAPSAMPDQASIRGAAQVRVDPLANDFDPDGGILTVTAASADTAKADVAVVSGKWVLVTPTSGDTAALNVNYTVSNGSQEVSSTITVIRLPDLPNAQPLVKDDLAVVRAGDSVLVSALANDIEPNGGTLQMVTNLPGQDAVGELTVYSPGATGNPSQEELGRAFVHNNKVRYVAPQKVSEETQVVVEYHAQNSAGQRSATGKVLVTVRPEPADVSQDMAPLPEPIEARVNAGDRGKVSIPTGSQDPDGDSVTVIGLGSAPALGRVVGMSPTGLTYEAYPDPGSFGTDTFSILVADRYGKASAATVRIGVTQPGNAQAPLAVEDAIIAEPGLMVRADALANDLYSRSDRVEVAPLKNFNDQLPADVELSSASGPIAVRAPSADAQPVIVQYALQGNAGVGPAAAVKVTGQVGFKNPPVIHDEVAVADGQVAKADLLAKAWDPDGRDDKLTVSLLGGPQDAKLNGGKLEVPLTGQTQVIPFRVEDETGAASVAVVFVPSAGTSAPHLRSGGLIRIDKDSTLSLNLSDYVYSPRDREVRFTPDSAFSASPVGKIEVEPTGGDTFKVTSKDGYVGPAAVTFEVMDGASATEDGVLKAVVSVPVQVGPDTPVLRCPTTALKLMAGGQDQPVDIATMCHVWSPDPSALEKMVFTAEWQGQPIAGVEADSGQRVTFRASGSAIPGQQGTMMIGIRGTNAIKQPLNLLILAAPAPAMSGRTFTDIKQGTPVTVPLGIKSPLRDAVPTVIETRKISGPDAKVESSGASLVVTPGNDSHGVIVYEVTASDVADRSRTDRQVTAKFTFEVYGRPDAPGAPTPGERAQSKSENLTWSVPANNGAAIQKYVVTSSLGKTYNCPANSCRIEGLKNNVPVKFKVHAVNRAGDGPDSAWSREIVPDQPPPAPSGLSVTNPRDRLVTLRWAPIVVDGSPVKTVYIIIGGRTYQTARGDQTSFELPMPDNNSIHQITVVAENNYGKSGPATVVGQSAGVPIGLRAPRFSPVSQTGAATAVNISWDGVDKNGPNDLTYSVVRDGNKTICSSVGRTSCVDDQVTYNGAEHRYTLSATNGAGGAAHTATITGTWTAVGVPDRGGAPAVAATGADRKVKVSGTFPDSRGKGSRLEILRDGAVVHKSEVNPRGGGFATEVELDANGVARSISYRICNEERCGPASPGVSVSAFGPITDLKISDAGTEGSTVKYTVSVNPNGKPVTVKVNGKVVTTTGTGPWSGTFSEDIGWSNTKEFVAEASDSGRASVSASTKMTTPAMPAPPEVKVLAGRSALGLAGCNSPRCHYVKVEVSNFKAPVSCSITDTKTSPNSWSGTGYGTPWRQEAKSVFETINYFGYYGVKVTCTSAAGERVTGTNPNWPN